MKDINILWFKKDLRIDDNEALYESLKNNDILPIYIFEIELWNQKTHSRRQWQFCKESVLDLRNWKIILLMCNYQTKYRYYSKVIIFN